MTERKKCYNHICVICGKSFYHPATNAKTCGPDCARVHRSQRRKAWEIESGFREKRTAERQEAAGGSDRKKPTRSGAGPVLAPGARGGNLTPEYWQKWKKSELKFAESMCRRSASCVNGISVNDPDFVDKVLITIEERGAVFTFCGLERNGG